MNTKNLIALLGLSIILVSCSGATETTVTSDDTSIIETTTEVVENIVEEEQGVLIGGALMVPSLDIIDNAVNSADHTTLVAAVQAADLVEALKGDGPFTVFAPNNAAFDALPDGTVDTLLLPENQSDLAGILTYHVVPWMYTSADLVDGLELTTLQWDTITFSYDGNVWLVNDAVIEIADAVSSNGVTHSISGVLLPSSEDEVDSEV